MYAHSTRLLHFRRLDFYGYDTSCMKDPYPEWSVYCEILIMLQKKDGQNLVGRLQCWSLYGYT